MSFISPKPVLFAATAALLCATAAHASAVFTDAQTDFTGGSALFGFQGRQFTFSDVSSGGFDSNPVAVMTAAGAAVTALGAPFYNPPQPTTYFDPIRGSGTLLFDAGYQYSGFATPTRIPFSASPSFIGLALTLDDGIHYGFARFAGTYLVSYAFESTPGLGIDVASTIAPVPEPETYALMLAGLGVLGFAARRRRGQALTALAPAAA